MIKRKKRSIEDMPKNTLSFVYANQELQHLTFLLDKVLGKLENEDQKNEALMEDLGDFASPIFIN